MIGIRTLLQLIFPSLIIICLIGFHVWYLNDEYHLLHSETMKRFANVQEVFTDSIKSDVLEGRRSEVYGRCRQFFASDLKYLKIELSDGFVVCELGIKVEASKLNEITSNVLFSADGGPVAAKINSQVNLDRLANSFEVRKNKISLLILGVGFLLFVIARFLLGNLFQSIDRLTKSVLEGKLSGLESSATAVSKATSLREIKDIAIGFQQMVEKLREYSFKVGQQDLEIERSRVYAQVVHDLKSPLSVVNILSQKTSKSEDPVARELLESVGRRINQIFSDLSASITDSVEKGSVKASKIAAWALSEKRVEYPFGTWTLESDILPRFEPAIPLTQSNLARVLSNILNNSVEARREGDQLGVTVRISYTDRFCEIVVSDNGRGMEPSILNKVRSEGGTFGKVGGQGLGLSHARELMKKAGGDFQITSQLGTGTQVKLLLPLL